MPDWRDQFADELYNGFEVTQKLNKAAGDFEAVVRRQYTLMDRGNMNIRYMELHVHPSVEFTIKEEVTMDGQTWVVETVDPFYYSNRVVLSFRSLT